MRSLGKKRLFLGTALLLGIALGAAMAQAGLIDDFDPALTTVTATQSGSAPGPAVNAGGPDGNYLRLINNVNSQVNHYAYDQTDAGLWTNITADFDFRATSPDDAADGFSMIFLPTITYGTSGSGITGYSEVEEPNFVNTFAVGFDLHPAGSVNDVSVHYGTERRNVTVSPAQVDFDAGLFHHATVALLHTPVGTRVTVDLTNDVNGAAGPTITPIVAFIPDLLPYDSRVQFSGRTGGLNVDVDLDNVNVQYSTPYAPATVSPNTLYQDFDSAGGTPLTFTQANSYPGAIVHDGGPTGNYMRLMDVNSGSQNNRIAFDRALDGGVSNSLKGTYDFRINPSGNPGDGYSILLLPTSTYGDAGEGAGFTAEEPNVAGAFGVGFDLYPGLNNVSLHWNGVQVAEVAVPTASINLDASVFHRAEVTAQHVAGGSNVTVTLTPDVYGVPGTPVTVFSNQFVAGMTPYDYRAQFSARSGGARLDVDLDNISSGTAPIATPGATVQDFEGGGSAYQVNSYGSTPHPAIRNDAGPEGNYLRLVNPAGGQDNVMALDRTAEGAYGRITASFDMRITSGADGAAFALMNTADYGVTGAGPASLPFPGGDGWEEANLLNSFAVGFDIHNNIHEVSLHWDEAARANATSTFDYRNAGFNTVDVTLDFSYGGAYVDLSIAGTPVYTNQWIAGVTPYEARVALGGRTGGITCTLDIDDLNVQYFRDTVTWTNAGTGNYPDGPNWDSGHSPSHADHAVIPIGQANSTNLDINGPGSVTVSGTGTLNNTGNLQIGTMAGETGVLNVDGGVVNASGRLRLAPQANTDAIVNQNGGTVTVAGRFEMTDNSSAQSAYHLSGDGVLTVNGDYFIVGRQGIGTFTQSDTSVVNVNVSQRMLIGDVGGTGSTYTMTGGTLNVNGGKQLVVGKGGTGAFYQSGGTVNASGRLALASDGNARPGRYELSGDAVLNVSGDYFLVGQAGEGTFVQSDSSTVNANLGTEFIVGDWGGAAGDYELSGGTLNVGNGRTMFVGKNGDGHFRQTGGTVNASGRLHVGGGAASTGDYRLEDGTVNVGTHLVVGDSGTGVFTQTGGTVNVLTGGHGLYVGDQSSSDGTYVISGGALNVNALRRGGSAGNTTRFHVIGADATINVINEYNLNSADVTVAFDLNSDGISTVNIGSYGNLDGALQIGILGGAALWDEPAHTLLSAAGSTLNNDFATKQESIFTTGKVNANKDYVATLNSAFFLGATDTNCGSLGFPLTDAGYVDITLVDDSQPIELLLTASAGPGMAIDDLIGYMAGAGLPAEASTYPGYDIRMLFPPRPGENLLHFGWDLRGFNAGAGISGLVANVPEPATWSLLALGLGGLWFFARRRRR